MTPACGRCGARAIAHVNGVGRQCLMCGEEHAQDDRGGAVAVEVDAKVVQDQEDAGKVTVRARRRRWGSGTSWCCSGRGPASCRRRTGIPGSRVAVGVYGWQISRSS